MRETEGEFVSEQTSEAVKQARLEAVYGGCRRYEVEVPVPYLRTGLWANNDQQR